KSERILNILLAAMVLLMAWMIAEHEDCILGDHTSEPPIVELRIDTVWVHDTIETPGPVVVREEVREVPARVDTAAVLQRYFTARTLSDTFHLRDVATVRITDTVFQNNIVARTIDYDLAKLDISLQRRKPRIGTPPARLALSVGVQLGSEQTAVIGGVRCKRTELGLGYDLSLHAPSIFFKYDLWQWQ
ncbi:MAG: hypothetical protein IJT75_10755, partial [Bacteroidaceae bacterium]|nr:hypothetical protein [Bacteroidaceae bacterium]